MARQLTRAGSGHRCLRCDRTGMASTGLVCFWCRRRFVAYVDGASDNLDTTAPAAWGWHIDGGDGETIAVGSGLVAPGVPQTSNAAEFTAIVRALEYAAENAIDLDEVRTDSRLVAEAVAGRWKCRAAHLVPLRDRAQELLGDAVVRWIPREKNREADALAVAAKNAGLAGVAS